MLRVREGRAQPHALVILSGVEGQRMRPGLEQPGPLSLTKEGLWGTALKKLIRCRVARG